MSVQRLLYNMMYPIALAGARVSSLFLPKMREAIAGRSGYRERWRAFGATLREAPVLFHVASVGEFEQARPVISAIRRSHPDTPVMVTFSSPSGYHFWKRRQQVEARAIDFADYLPFDRAKTVRFCLDAAKPRRASSPGSLRSAARGRAESNAARWRW